MGRQSRRRLVQWGEHGRVQAHPDLEDGIIGLNDPVPAAGVWLGGQEYTCDKDGKAVVPFTAQPGRRPVVLSRGAFCCLDTIDHQPEAYRLAAGIFVDRESLLTSKVAAVVVRPALFLNDRPVSVKLLEGLHARWATLLRSLTEADWGRAYYHPEHQREFALQRGANAYLYKPFDLGHVMLLMESLIGSAPHLPSTSENPLWQTY